MLFLNRTGLAYTDSATPQATSIGTIESIKIQNGIYKELFATKNLALAITDPIAVEWDFDTIIHAIYSNGTLEGGNVEFGISNTTDLLLKCREKGTFEWTTIYHKEINNKEDFSLVNYYRYARAGVPYEYALVPVNNGTEYNYNIVECTNTFEGMFLCEKDGLFQCFLDFKLDRQRNKPSITINTLNRKMPIYIANATTKYDSGSVSATMLKYVDCELDEKNAWKYRDEFLDFLCDGNAKVMKTFDGKLYIVQIIGEPSEPQGDYWNAPTTSFNWVQVGEITNKELYEQGLLDISSEWWSL